MELVTWKDEYSVELVIIDNQHKHLIFLINGLHKSMLNGNNKESLVKILAELIEYTNTHFVTEEMYFEEFNYKDTEEHKKEHNLFIDQIVRAKKEYETCKTRVSEELLVFLQNWLIKHISGSDKKYISCFKENGLV